MVSTLGPRYQAVQPPSLAMIWPVMKADASLARKQAQAGQFPRLAGALHGHTGGHAGIGDQRVEPVVSLQVARRGRDELLVGRVHGPRLRKGHSHAAARAGNQGHRAVRTEHVETDC